MSEQTHLLRRRIDPQQEHRVEQPSISAWFLAIPHTNTSPDSADNTSLITPRSQTQRCDASHPASGNSGRLTRRPTASSQWDNSASSSGSIALKPRPTSSRATQDFPEPGLPVTRYAATSHRRRRGITIDVVLRYSRSGSLGGGRAKARRHTRAVAATPPVRWTTVTIDCSDAETLGGFYALLLGWEITARDGAGWLQLRQPDGGVGLNIQADDSYEAPTWPEQPGCQAKMMHLEILVDDLEAAVQLVVRGGGTEASHQPADRDPTRLRVMLDPAPARRSTSHRTSSRRSSTYSAMARLDVAAGDGALRMLTTPSRSLMRKSSRSDPSRSTA